MNYAIFGGSKGIGYAVAEQLLQEGHSVWVYSRSGSGPAGAHFIVWDAENEGLPADLPAELHGVVYAPGSINLKPFRGLKLEDFQKDLAVNFFGAVKALQTCLPSLKAVASSLQRRVNRKLSGVK